VSGKGKVDHGEMAAHYANLVGEDGPDLRETLIHEAVAHAVLALVEEVRALRDALDAITEDSYHTDKRRVLVRDETQ
jgi:hypothetical protein